MHEATSEKDPDVRRLRRSIVAALIEVQANIRRSAIVLGSLLLLFWVTLKTSDKVPNFLSGTGYLASMGLLTYFGTCLKWTWESVENQRSCKKSLRELLEDRYELAGSKK